MDLKKVSQLENSQKAVKIKVNSSKLPSKKDSKNQNNISVQNKSSALNTTNETSLINGSSLQFSNEKNQPKTDDQAKATIEYKNEIELLKKAFMEVVTINETLEGKVESLELQVQEKDLVIEAQNKAITELADKIDELTDGQFLKDLNNESES